jgi:hypothetical protein
MPSLLLPRQGHAFGGGPEVFEGVEVARFGVEQMDHHGTVVEQDPTTLAVALNAEALIAEIGLQRAVDFLADRMELSPAVAGDEDEVVELRRDATHVEKDDVRAAVVVGGARGGESELQAALAAGFELRGGVGDGRGSCDGTNLAAGTDSF